MKNLKRAKVVQQVEEYKNKITKTVKQKFCIQKTYKIIASNFVPEQLKTSFYDLFGLKKDNLQYFSSSRKRHFSNAPFRVVKIGAQYSSLLRRRRRRPLQMTYFGLISVPGFPMYDDLELGLENKAHYIYLICKENAQKTIKIAGGTRE